MFLISFIVKYLMTFKKLSTSNSTFYNIYLLTHMWVPICSVSKSQSIKCINKAHESIDLKLP